MLLVQGSAYRPFRHGTFWQESFPHGCFITGTFRHVHHSALQTFRQMDISTWEHFDMGTFRHEDFSARGRFGTGTFWHGDISAHGHFGTVAQVPKCLCQNVHIALQGAKISLCRNVQVPKIPHAENSPCRKFPMSKCSGVEMSICRNVRSAEWCMCRNVPVMKNPRRNDSCRNVPYRNGL